MEAIVLSKNQRKRANRRARAQSQGKPQGNSQLVVYEPQQGTLSTQQVQKVSLPGQGTSRSARRRRAQRRRGVRGGVGADRNLYLASLIDPENNPGAKVPDMVTFPSSTIQLTADISLNPGTGGDGTAIIFTPIIGTPDGTTLSPIYQGTNTAAFGNYTWASNNWTKAATVRGLYDSYRPVSAVMYAEFIGASTNDGGQICMGIIPRSGAVLATDIEALVVNYNTAIAQSFTKSLPLRNGAVITWKPMDNKDLEYKDIQDNTAADHELPHIFVCTAGQAATGATMRFRMVANFELIPTTDTATIIQPLQSTANSKQLEEAMNWASQTYNNMSAFVTSVSPYVQPVLSGVTKAATNLGLSYVNNVLASSRGNSLRLQY